MLPSELPDLSDTADRSTFASRAEYVYETIRSEIHAQRLTPGHRVREAELAGWLQVSRTPIREAIRRLLENGLLGHNESGQLIVATLDKLQVSELYSLRAVMEGAAASFAAQHASADDIARMHELVEACANGVSAKEAAHYNNLLHETIHLASHNRYLMILQQRFSDWTVLLPGTTLAEEGRVHATRDEHNAIVRAIADGDSERASAFAIQHINNSYKVRRRMMFET